MVVLFFICITVINPVVAYQFIYLEHYLTDGEKGFVSDIARDKRYREKFTCLKKEGPSSSAYMNVGTYNTILWAFKNGELTKAQFMEHYHCLSITIMFHPDSFVFSEISRNIHSFKVELKDNRKGKVSWDNLHEAVYSIVFKRDEDTQTHSNFTSICFFYDYMHRFGGKNVCQFEKKEDNLYCSLKQLTISSFSEIASFFLESKETKASLQICPMLSYGEKSELDACENVYSLALWFPEIKSLETVGNVWVGNQTYIFHLKSFNCLKQSKVELNSLWSYYYENAIPFVKEYELQVIKEKTCDQIEEETLWNDLKIKSSKIWFLDMFEQILHAQELEMQQDSPGEDKSIMVHKYANDEDVIIGQFVVSGRVRSLVAQLEMGECFDDKLTEPPEIKRGIPEFKDKNSVGGICHKLYGAHITERKKKPVGSSGSNSRVQRWLTYKKIAKDLEAKYEKERNEVRMSTIIAFYRAVIFKIVNMTGSKDKIHKIIVIKVVAGKAVKEILDVMPEKGDVLFYHCLELVDSIAKAYKD